MDAAGSAVGIISLGISVCQGLLFYYDGYRKYDSDIKQTCDTIEDLNKTLALLKDTVENDTLDVAKKDRVKDCVEACETSLEELDEEKLKIQPIPNNTIQSHLKRIKYPFRQSTLQKLRELVGDVQDRLKLALQVLQLDLSIQSTVVEQRILKDTGDILGRTKNIETSVDKLVVTSRVTGDILVRTKNIETSVDNLVTTTKDTGDVLLGRTRTIETSVKDIQSVQKSEEWRQILDWLSAPDPWTNHNTARRLHEAHTGSWLVESERYLHWKSNDGHLWLYGKAGCGKTVLCSTVIEDIKARSDADPDIGLAIFYFSFSDERKQSHESLLRSLVGQLAWKGPALTMLSDAFKRPNLNSLSPNELNNLLLTAVTSYKEVFVVLDALDECPEDGNTNAREDVLEWIKSFAQDVTPFNIKFKVLVTSRELIDIRSSMESIKAETVSIAPSDVNIDIRRHVTTQISKDPKLSCLDQTTKTLIENTLSNRADGMFRWADLQLLELKRLKSMKRKYIESALNDLPKTLDKTYERMLLAIDEKYWPDALILLRWLAYAISPLALEQLAETTITDPANGGSVDWDGRGGLEDPLQILAGLVVTIDHNEYRSEALADLYPDLDQDADSDVSSLPGTFRGIRLAHFSVKEFLGSDRLLRSEAKYFHLNSGLGHEYLTEACLTYLMHCSLLFVNDEDKDLYEEVEKFPLFSYAANFWPYHASLKQSDEWRLEMAFLSSDTMISHWQRPYSYIRELVGGPKPSPRSSMHFASRLGLIGLVRTLILEGADVNAHDDLFGTVLQAAARGSDAKTMEVLFEHGADVNAKGGKYDSALRAAVKKGNKEGVEMLLNRGADFNVPEGETGRRLVNTPLHDAVRQPDGTIARLLLDRGAHVNVCGEGGHTVLQAAAMGRCDDETIKLLLSHGADVNAEGRFGTALAYFASAGKESIVAMLLDHGADVNARSGKYGDTALIAAAEEGYEPVVNLLLARGADTNVQADSVHPNALAAAISRWTRHWQKRIDGPLGRIIETLLDHRADINGKGVGYHNSALETAVQTGFERGVEILLDRGADVHLSTGQSSLRSNYKTILEIAEGYKHDNIAKMLIAKGARRYEAYEMDLGETQVGTMLGTQ